MHSSLSSTLGLTNLVARDNQLASPIVSMDLQPSKSSSQTYEKVINIIILQTVKIFPVPQNDTSRGHSELGKNCGYGEEENHTVSRSNGSGAHQPICMSTSTATEITVGA